MSAQAQAATSFSVKASDEANKLCFPPSPTEVYQYTENKAEWFPAKVSVGFIETTDSNGVGSATNITKTNLYGKSCSERDEKARIYITSHCVAKGQCHADKFEDENGKVQDIQEVTQTMKSECNFLGICSSPAGTVNQPATPQPVITPDPATPAAAPVQAAAPAGDAKADKKPHKAAEEEKKSEEQAAEGLGALFG